MIETIANNNDVLKGQWTGLSWQEQNHNFLSQRLELNGRKMNWYMIVDGKDPELFTWIKKKGIYSSYGESAHLIHNQ